MSHTQCLLAKGNQQQISWIPSKFAVKGKYVKLRVQGGQKTLHEADCRCGQHTCLTDGVTVGDWDDGWLVTETWTTMDSGDVNERSRDFKNQRKASDRPRDGGRGKIRERK